MKDLTRIAKLLHWPAVFAALSLLLNDTWCVAMITLALAFRSDVSAVLRRRCLVLETPGFKGRIDGDDGATKRPTSRRSLM